MTIRELPGEIVRKIAAGEVVERPASAVKELVENSIDADASRIDVAVDAGGTERVRVADDGVGMTREEVRLAVCEHTTSKIGGADDLGAISTLGFRGEALYAIGAVSRTTITTCARGGDRGTELAVEFGDVGEITPAGRPGGTTVEVRGLFGETPARRKFLKSEATEFDHVNRVVSRYALANPDVAISLSHGGREVFATTGQGDLEGALLSVYGREVAESMIPVDGDGVSGLVSHPETTRSTREYLATYVNGRYVTDSTVREPVLAAYDRQLASDRYPFAVVFVDVPPDGVDVNVHPRKLEVRFDDAAAVRERVRSAVEAALLEEGLLRSGAPRGVSAPAETTISPESASDPDADANRESVASSDADAAADRESVASSGPDADPRSASSGPDASGSGSTADERGTAGPESTANEREAAGPGATASEGPSAGSPSTAGSPSDPSASAPAPSGEAADGWTAPESLPVEGGGQTTLDAGPVESPGGFERLPGLRVLGQLRDTYVVAETDDGLVLIDQHAADERVNYERLREQFADGPGSQSLAEPVAVELTAREAELFSAHSDALETLGFRAVPAGDRTVEVRAVPAVFAAALPPELLRDLLSEIVREREATTVDERADALLADLACYPSITGNTSLTEGSIHDLLTALDACENPYACPHGRPVVVAIDADELAARFERDYPGHPGRRLE